MCKRKALPSYHRTMLALTLLENLLESPMPKWRGRDHHQPFLSIYQPWTLVVGQQTLPRSFFFFSSWPASSPLSFFPLFYCEKMQIASIPLYILPSSRWFTISERLPHSSSNIWMALEGRFLESWRTYPRYGQWISCYGYFRENDTFQRHLGT